MIVWLLLAIPISGAGGFADTPMQNSAFAGAARTAAPTLKPAGLGSYEIAGTLFTGFVAKEVVVSTLGQVYGTQGEQAPAGYHPVDDLVTSGKDFVGALRDAAVAVPGIVGINLARQRRSGRSGFGSAAASRLRAQQRRARRARGGGVPGLRPALCPLHGHSRRHPP